jgi:hypothetical protein
MIAFFVLADMPVEQRLAFAVELVGDTRRSIEGVGQRNLAG